MKILKINSCFNCSYCYEKRERLIGVHFTIAAIAQKHYCVNSDVYMDKKEPKMIDVDVVSKKFPEWCPLENLQ